MAAVAADARAGVPKGVIGARFHRAVAELVIDMATSAGCAQTVALSGGVFQNTLLLRLVVHALRDRGFAVITHRLVPPTTAASRWANCWWGITAKREDAHVSCGTRKDRQRRGP